MSIRYLIRRLAVMIPVFFFVITFVFFMMCMICSPSELLVLLTIRTAANPVNRPHQATWYRACRTDEVTRAPP